MSVVPALLNFPEDISQYSPIALGTSFNGTGAFTTLINTAGKGGLLCFKITGVSLTYEIKITIDGSVWLWLANSIGSTSGYVSGALIDFDDGSANGTSMYTRSVRGVSQAVLQGTFLASPNPGATSGIAGTLIIREPIPFNSSVLVEAKAGNGQVFNAEIFGYYK